MNQILQVNVFLLMFSTEIFARTDLSKIDKASDIFTFLVQEARLNGVRSSITVIRIRRFNKGCFSFVQILKTINLVNSEFLFD